MPYTGTSLYFECAGEFSLGRRGKEEDHPAICLIRTDVDGIDLRAAIPEDGEQFEIEIAGYHVENEDTGEAYHANLCARLSKADVARLHAYLGFVLEHGDLDRTLPKE